MQYYLFFLANIVISVTLAYNIVLIREMIYLSIITLQRKILFITSLTICLCILRQIILFSSNNISLAICKILVFTVFFVTIYKILDLKLWRAVFILCITAISMSVGESIILGVFLLAGLDIKAITTGDNLIMYFLGNLFINLFQMMVIYLIKISKTVSCMAAGIKNKTYIYISLNIAIAVIVITVMMIMLCFNRQQIWIMALYGTLSAIGLFCSIVSIRMLVHVDFRDEKLKMQEQYNEILIDLKHKFFGITSILTALVEEENLLALKEYIKELNQNFVERIKNMPTNIVNNKLFYLITLKIKEAHDNGINIKVIIPNEIVSIIGMREDDFIYVLNELLSNAIEHSKNSEEREIYIRIDNLSELTKIIIENSVSDTIMENRLMILDNDISKTGRGYGLKQIKKLIGDNAYFKTSITDRFIAELIIKKAI